MKRLIGLSIWVFAQVRGYDDDFADMSFSCPIGLNPNVGSCHQVCELNATSCPTELTCDSGNLCIDGSCQDVCPTDLSNPCISYPPYTTACYMGGYLVTPSECSEVFESQYSVMDSSYVYDDDYYSDDIGKITCFI
jgi:hypothetical protein